MEIRNNNNITVRDVSEIEPAPKIIPEAGKSGSYEEKPVASGRVGRLAAAKKTGRLAMYFSDRKYFFMIFSVIFIVGMATGLFIIKSGGTAEIFGLREIIDSRSAGLTAPEMTSRIINSVTAGIIAQFLIYAAGFTVFSSFVSAAVFLYKGTSLGYISGIYLIGGTGRFHIAACALNLSLNILCAVFLIAAAAEALSFSVFLLKSEDSYRKTLSFENISRYSSRHLLLIILISAASALLALLPPLFYSLCF